uniref:Cooconase 5 n=1 Tax=Heliconius aoede TaxID=33457 RepID=A0A3G2LYE2_9NEOP|nr:cooconase 5 [Heliconius aoede]
MKLFLVLIFLIFLVSDVLCKKRRQTKSFDNKIVGGYSTTIENFPYQVRLILQKGNVYYGCGGSIISPHYVLTAAHCLTGISKVFIRTGSTRASSGGVQYTSTNFTRHPNYNERNVDYDVGLVSPSTPIQLDNRTKVVTLASRNSELKSGTPVLVTGWGSTSENGASSDTLMAVEVPTVSNDECRKKYRSLTERMFCAGVPQGGKDSCQGDSGGPAVIKSSRVQLGIVSFGVGCARRGYPGVYSKISNSGIRDWIQKVARV